MKRVEIILFAALISAALITACYKNSSNDVAPAATTTKSAERGSANQNLQAPTQVAGNVAVTTPQLTCMLNPFGTSEGYSPVKWTSGYLTVSTINFSCNYKNGDDMVNRSYSTLVNQKIDLRLPPMIGIGPMKLGVIDILAATCYGPVVGIDLVSQSQASESVQGQLSANNDALYLAGTFNYRNMPIDVTLFMTQNLVLNSDGPNPLLISPSQNYTAMVQLNLNLIMTGITTEMMQGAINENKIVISANSNVALYQVILNNLQSNFYFQLYNTNPSPVNL